MDKCTNADLARVKGLAFYAPWLPAEYDYAYELYLLDDPVAGVSEMWIARDAWRLSEPRRCGDCGRLRRHFIPRPLPDGSPRCYLCHDTERDQAFAEASARREVEEQPLRVALAEPVRHCMSCEADLPRAHFPVLPLGRPWEDHHRCDSCVRLTARCVKYGITAAAFWELHAIQGGACGSCLTPMDAATLNIDHCHVTGVVRGLLCTSCNQGLGFLGDDLAGVERAADYLRRALGHTRATAS